MLRNKITSIIMTMFFFMNLHLKQRTKLKLLFLNNFFFMGWIYLIWIKGYKSNCEWEVYFVAGANMFVLHSFMQPAVKLLGQVNNLCNIYWFFTRKKERKRGEVEEKKQKGNERNTNGLLGRGGGVKNVCLCSWPGYRYWRTLYLNSK